VEPYLEQGIRIGTFHNQWYPENDLARGIVRAFHIG
jgi:hypothetical protein